MRKFFKRILCVTLFVILLITCLSCQDTDQEQPARKRKQIIQDSNILLVEEGSSDYRILLREGYDEAENYAAHEFNRLLKEASGVTLPVVVEADLSLSTKYISIGNTAMSRAAGVNPTRQYYTRNGFQIVSYGEGLVINAPERSGLIYGVYRFFEKNCGYMYYATDEWKITKGENITLKRFDFEDWPDFLNRDVFNYDTREDPAHAMRLYTTGSNYSVWSSKFGEGGWWSTLHDQSLCYQLLPFTKYRKDHDDWYCGGNGDGNNTTNPQLCYTTALYDRDKYEKGNWNEENYNDGRHGAFWTLVYNLINNYIAVETDKTFFQLGMSDNYEFCDCEQCRKDVEKYSRSGVAIRFANAVADEVEKWRLENAPEREIYLTMFAFLSIVDPPTKIINGQHVPLDESVIARDNLVIRYAPIKDYYLVPLMDQDINANAYHALKGWSVCAKKFAVWDYRISFNDMIFPFPNWLSEYDNIQTYYQMGFIDVFNQGCRTFGGTPFIAMDNWIRARLLWDTTQNYEDLMNEFIDAYYKDAGDGIREYMDYLTMHYMGYMYQLGFKGHSHMNYTNSQNFPRGVVQNIEAIFKKMYDKIDKIKISDPQTYAKLKKRIDGESLFYRYCQINLYSHFYTSQELSFMIDEFERITTEVRMLGLTTTSGYFSEIIPQWRSTKL